MLSLGHANPFMKVASTYMYDSLDTAKEAVQRTGHMIQQGGTPAALGPLVFTFTGNGAVRSLLPDCCCFWCQERLPSMFFVLSVWSSFGKGTWYSLPRKNIRMYRTDVAVVVGR